MLHQAILVGENLCKRGYQGPHRCYNWWEEAEMCMHLFVSYAYAQHTCASTFGMTLEPVMDAQNIHDFILIAASDNGFIAQDMSFENMVEPWKHQPVALRRCVVLARKSLDNQKITITAQGRKDSNQNTDISIHAYNVTVSLDLVPLKNSTQVYLGRPGNSN
eukprot:Gb_26242 [translate_table: standard]